MQLHPDWKAILAKAWSIRLIIAAGLLSGLDVVLQALLGTGVVSIGVLALAMVVNTAAVIARVVVQENLPNG